MNHYPETLSERVKRLKAETSAFIKESKMDAKYSRSARIREDIATTGRFTYQLWQGFLWIREWILSPITGFFNQISQRIIHYYKRLWFFMVNRRTEDDMLVFSKTRAGAMVLVTGLFIWFAIIPILWCAYDAGLYALTVQHDEHLYLFGSQEINPTTGMHNIEGADHIPWTEQDSFYFRADGGLFPDLWSIFHNSRLWPPYIALYYPEYVGAAIPYGISRCFVTSYGIRTRLPFLSNTYSQLLSVSCSPMQPETRG